MVDIVSLVPLKEWARNFLPLGDELRDAILSEPDTLPRIEATAKLEAYSKMLEAKVRKMMDKYVS